MVDAQNPASLDIIMKQTADVIQVHLSDLSVFGFQVKGWNVGQYSQPNRCYGCYGSKRGDPESRGKTADVLPFQVGYTGRRIGHHRPWGCRGYFTVARAKVLGCSKIHRFWCPVDGGVEWNILDILAPGRRPSWCGRRVAKCQSHGATRRLEMAKMPHTAATFWRGQGSKNMCVFGVVPREKLFPGFLQKGW